MSWNNVKRRQTDILFSRYLRRKRGNLCERCKKWKEINLLQVSHFMKRRHENTRFLEANCDVICGGCHRYFESHLTEYEAWKREKLGDLAVNELIITAHRKGKRDDKLVMLWLKTLEGYPWKVAA